MSCPCGIALDKRNTSGLCRSCSGGAVIAGNRKPRKPPVPPELLAEYHHLTHSKRVPASEAKRMVLEAAGR